MNVKETIETINLPETPLFDSNRSVESAIEALAEWIADGGEVPHDAGNIDDETMESLEGSDLFPLACAVRVAIAYGDLSGLEGLGFEIAR